MKLQVFVNAELKAPKLVSDNNYEVTVVSGDASIKCKMYSKEKPIEKVYSVIILDTFSIKDMTAVVQSVVDTEQKVFTFTSGKVAKSETKYSANQTKYTNYSVVGKSLNKNNEGKYPALYTNTIHFRLPEFMESKLVKDARVGLFTETTFETYKDKLQEKHTTRGVNVIEEDKDKAVDIGF